MNGLDATRLVDAGTAARMADVAAGADTTNRLSVADLSVDEFGILEVEVRSVHAVKQFTRRDGKGGCLRRVTLGDASGEIDMVLWGDEVHQASAGPFTAGARLQLAGATVKAGFREGLELHLSAASVTPLPGPEPVQLVGWLTHIDETEISGERGEVRFQAQARLDTDDGPRRLVLWDDCIPEARKLLGARVSTEDALPHFALDNWYVVDGGSLRRA